MYCRHSPVVQCQKSSKRLKTYTRAMFFPLVLLGRCDAADTVADDAEQRQADKSPAQRVEEAEMIAAAARDVDTVHLLQATVAAVAVGATQGLLLRRDHVGDRPHADGLDEVVLAGEGLASGGHASGDGLVPVQVGPVGGVVLTGQVVDGQRPVLGVERLLAVEQL